MGFFSPRAELRVDTATAMSSPALGTSTSLLGEYPNGELAQIRLGRTQPKGLRAPIPWPSQLLQLHGAATEGAWGSLLKERTTALPLGTAPRSSQGTFQADHSTIPATTRLLKHCP